MIGGSGDDAMSMIGAEKCVSPQLFDEAQANIHRLLQQGQCVAARTRRCSGCRLVSALDTHEGVLGSG